MELIKEREGYIKLKYVLHFVATLEFGQTLSQTVALSSSTAQGA